MGVVDAGRRTRSRARCHSKLTTTDTYLNATTQLLRELNEQKPLTLVKGLAFKTRSDHAISDPQLHFTISFAVVIGHRHDDGGFPIAKTDPRRQDSRARSKLARQLAAGLVVSTTTCRIREPDYDDGGWTYVNTVPELLAKGNQPLDTAPSALASLGEPPGINIEAPSSGPVSFGRSDHDATVAAFEIENGIAVA